MLLCYPLTVFSLLKRPPTACTRVFVSVASSESSQKLQLGPVSSCHFVHHIILRVVSLTEGAGSGARCEAEKTKGYALLSS